MRQIGVQELETALRQGAVLVDVREPAEYAAGHVPGARLIPMSQLTARLGELDRSTPVHLICASGNRSSAMADVLAAQHFDVVDVVGGTTAWVEAGKPVEQGRGVEAR